MDPLGPFWTLLNPTEHSWTLLNPLKPIEPSLKYSNFRSNCFLCDYDLCRACVKAIESEDVIKIKDNPVFDKPVQNNLPNDENENSNIMKGREGSILGENDDIPLIDSQSESEDIPVLIEKIKERPKLVMGPQNIHFNPSVLDSPDIFYYCFLWEYFDSGK